MARVEQESEPQVPKIQQFTTAEVPQLDVCALLPPESRQWIEQSRNHLARSHHLFFVCGGTIGLGDSFLILRHTLNAIKGLPQNKEVCIQAPAPLIPILKKQTRGRSVEWVTKMSSQKLLQHINDGSILSPFPDERSTTNPESWIDIHTREQRHDWQDRLMFRRGSFLHDAANWRDLLTLTDKVSSVLKQDNANSIDLRVNLFFQLLGMYEQNQAFQQQPLLEVSPRKPDFDYIIAPDAGEREIEEAIAGTHLQVAKSGKSLSLPMWERLFPTIANKRAIIIQGTQHPQYCQAVAKIARSCGVDAYTFSGTLEECAQITARGKRYIGMDSGPTHLTLDVQRSLALQGQTLEIREIICGSDSFIQEYAIVDNPVLTFPAQSMAATAKLDLKLAPLISQYLFY